MVIDDETVSRRHALLEREGNRVVLLDLGSANGTFVNGARIVRLVLRSDHLIEIGDHQIAWEFTAESATETLQVGPASRGGPDPTLPAADAAGDRAGAHASWRPPRRHNLHVGHELDGFLSLAHGFLPVEPPLPAFPHFAPGLGRDDRPAARAVPPAHVAPGVRRAAGARRHGPTRCPTATCCAPRPCSASSPTPTSTWRSTRRRAARLAPATVDHGLAPAGQAHPGRLVHRPVLLQLAAARPGRPAGAGQHGPARADLEQRRRAGLLPGHHRIRDGAHAGAGRHARRPGGRGRRRPGRAGGRAAGDPRPAAARHPGHLPPDRSQPALPGIRSTRCCGPRRSAPPASRSSTARPARAAPPSRRSTRWTRSSSAGTTARWSGSRASTSPATSHGTGRSWWRRCARCRCASTSRTPAAARAARRSTTPCSTPTSATAAGWACTASRPTGSWRWRSRSAAQVTTGARFTGLFKDRTWDKVDGELAVVRESAARRWVRRWCSGPPRAGPGRHRPQPGAWTATGHPTSPARACTTCPATGSASWPRTTTNWCAARSRPAGHRRRARAAHPRCGERRWPARGVLRATSTCCRCGRCWLRPAPADRARRWPNGW